MLLMNSIKLRLNLHYLADVGSHPFFFFIQHGMPQGQINVNEDPKESAYVRFYEIKRRKMSSKKRRNSDDRGVQKPLSATKYIYLSAFWYIYFILFAAFFVVSFAETFALCTH